MASSGNRPRRRVSLAVVLTMVGGMLSLQVATSHAGAVACADVIAFRTMDVTFKPLARSYSVGDTARVAVDVARPASEDPLEQGVPVPTGELVPAAGATVGVGLHIGPVFSPGYAKTDDQGHAIVPIRIPTYAKPGPVGVEAYAYRIMASAPCYTLQEDGYARRTGAFTVTKK